MYCPTQIPCKLRVWTQVVYAINGDGAKEFKQQVTYDHPANNVTMLAIAVSIART